jgi:hypothetical protein
MKTIKHSILIILISIFYNCEDGIRDITGGSNEEIVIPTTTPVEPININTDGFDFLEKMQGHWVGRNLVITDDYPWFAWDYRAISPSHIHGIHENGTNGNLLTSFFVTDFKDTRTIMARNGGLLNGIYRTSYFVMDSISSISNSEKYFRFVDAKGGKGVMFFELRFKSDSLYFNAYTSRLGINPVPTRHMTFLGKKQHLDLSQTAAMATGFPQNIPAWDFSQGFREDYLYINSGSDEARSSTFVSQGDANATVYDLAPLSGDPFTISDHPRLGTLLLNINRDTAIEEDVLIAYLSKAPLTDSNGFFLSDPTAFDSVLHFPTLIEGEETFFYSYLHPGDYYVTVIADKDGDYGPSLGDVSSISTLISIGVEENKTATVTAVNVQN